MISNLLKLFNKWSVQGMHVPYFRDPTTGIPSLTTIFPYISFILSVISIIALHFKPNLILATYTTLGFWAASVIFYKLRGIGRAKVNLNDKSILIEDHEPNKPN